MERWRHRLPCILHQLGLGIDEVDVTRPALHEAPDDILCARGDVRGLWIERIRFFDLSQRVFLQKACQRNCREAAACLFKELAAGGDSQMVSLVIHRLLHQLMYRNSFDAKSIWQRSTNAAARAGSIPSTVFVGIGGFVPPAAMRFAMIDVCCSRNAVAVLSSSAVAPRP